MTDAVTDIPITKEKDDDKVESKEDTVETKKGEEDTKEPAQSQPKQRSVSFNRDVHVKRFGKPRETRGSPSEYQLRKQPFTYLSEQELIDEAAKVIAQADSVSCTADHPPEKFFSLPHRKKPKPDFERFSARRKSDDLGETEEKKALGRSTSDVGTPRKRGKERTSLSTLFRRAKTTSPDRPVVVATTPKSVEIVTTKPGVIVKRSKSDVSDLKSSTNIDTKPKPIRKRSGSESEEFLKSLRNKKAQLSPIIEATAREDYFNTSPIKFKKELTTKNSNTNREESKNLENSDSHKVNPVEKPPRFKSPDKSEDPKPPTRIKRSKAVTDLSDPNEPQITETPKRKTEIKKTLLVDEIDKVRGKDISSAEIKDRIKESIHKLQHNLYGEKEMIHSSQQPPDKPPLTKGHTVDHIVKILKEDQFSPPPKAHLIVPQSSGSNNQPFSYTRPSVSPDPNLYIHPISPERPLTPVNKMYPDKNVVYAQVVRNQKESEPNGVTKQTIHKTYSPLRGEIYRNHSDEDEGLGYEDQQNKYTTRIKYNYDYDKKEDDSFKKDTFRTMDSPIKPRFREFKQPMFDDFEPTYANEFPEKSRRDFVDTTYRGRADGMDSKRRGSMEPESAKVDRYDLNDLSHRRQLLESRINARRIGEKTNGAPITTYHLLNSDPIAEAENRMKATEKYVNETARYYRRTLERDGYVENSISDTYRKTDSENKDDVNYNTESRTFEKVKRPEPERILTSEERAFPPEPEYEPPSLESNISIDKKFKAKSRITSSHDMLHTGHKYSKSREERFGKRKGHYASNPEIVQEREELYENAKYDPKYADTYHNSLRRDTSYDRQYKENRFRDDRNVRRHGSDEARDYKYIGPNRFDNDRDRDNRFVDSGIENDYRKDSSGEINRTNKTRHYNTNVSPHRVDSDDEGVTSSLLIASERRHTEDNYPSEQIYANGNYHGNLRKPKYTPRERSIDDGSHYDPRLDRFEKNAERLTEEKVSAKPPKATKKLSGLEKVKQLFSSSKKSKKEKEIQTKPRTRVLKSPEHLAPSEYQYEERRRYDRSPDRYEPKDDLRRRYTEYRGSSDDRSPKPSDVDSELKSREPSRMSRSRTADPIDSPRLAERYSHRRRLATPSPTPSPPRRAPLVRPIQPPETSAGNWFKSLDRLTRKRNKASKVVKESGVTTEDESTVTKNTWNTKGKPVASPAKNLRFFGDTDQDSDANVSKHTVVTKSKSHPIKTPLRKTISNSSNGLDELDRSDLSKKSYSLTNLRDESPKRAPPGKDYKYKNGRNLHNISEIHSNSETESQFEERHFKSRRYDAKDKPPMSPYDRRSRSQSSSKNVVHKGSKSDLRRNGYNSSRSELRGEDRGSSSELRTSKERSGSRGDLKSRRRTPGAQSGESSTEGESSHQSQRSVVYLHATTIGDIPNPGRTRGRSRDDVSSVNSSNMQSKTVARSFSLLAPWRPRHYAEPYDVHYAQTARPTKRTHKQAAPKNESLFGKKSSSTKNLSTGTLKNRSSSQTTLNRKKATPSRLTSSNNTLYKKSRNGNSSSKENIDANTLSRSRNDYKKSVSTEVLSREPNRSERDRVSRSISMPKDNNKKAGWFKLAKNKKPEQSSRVR